MAVEKVCDQSVIPPLIFQLPPWEGWKRLEEAQSTPVYMYPARVRTSRINTGKWSSVPIYFIESETVNPIRNVVFYIHGAGWVFGSFHTHEKLVRELAVRTDSMIVFPEYSRASEAKYPTTIEQCFYILCHLRELLGDDYPEIDWRTLTVAGDSVGDNMAIAMTLMVKMRCRCREQYTILLCLTHWTRRKHAGLRWMR